MAQIVKLGLGIASSIHLGSGIEGGNQVASLDLSSVREYMGQGHAAVISGDLGNKDFRGEHGLHNSGDPDFPFIVLRLLNNTGGGCLDWHRGTAAGCQEESRNRQCEQTMTSRHIVLAG